MTQLFLKLFVQYCAIPVLALLFLSYLVRTVKSGRAVRRSFGGPDRIEVHQHLARRILWVNLWIIVFVEALKRGLLREHHLPSFDAFVQIHLWGFVLPYFVLLLLTEFWFTGLKHQRIHKWVAYPLFFFGCATTAAGIALTLME